MIEFSIRPQEEMDYDTAWLYCVTCTHDNYYDWRLPTHIEYNESPLIMNWYEDRYLELGFGVGNRQRNLHVTPVRTKDA
jgi:hypothetical protein